MNRNNLQIKIHLDSERVKYLQYIIIPLAKRTTTT